MKQCLAGRVDRRDERPSEGGRGDVEPAEQRVRKRPGRRRPDRVGTDTGVTSVEAVACASVSSRARTVTVTGTSVAASGGTTIVTGTVTVPPAGTACGSDGSSTVHSASLATASRVSARSAAAPLAISRAAGTRWASVQKPATSPTSGVNVTSTGRSVDSRAGGSGSPDRLTRYGPVAVTRRNHGDAIARAGTSAGRSPGRA